MEIGSTQQQIKLLLQPIQHPRLGAFVGLQEEVGELSKAIMQYEVYGEKDKENLAEECADVLISLMDIGNAYNIDLDAVTHAKIESMRKQLPGWTAKYAARLKRLREKFDPEV